MYINQPLNVSTYFSEDYRLAVFPSLPLFVCLYFMFWFVQCPSIIVCPFLSVPSCLSILVCPFLSVH